MQTTTMDLTEYGKLAKSDCFVCRIVAGNPLVPGVQIVDEDDLSISFLNQFPTQEGYALVCPKRHIKRFESDMTSAEWTRLQQKVQQVAQAVSQTTNAARMYIASWGSADRNNHLHIHVCPCPQGTPLERQQLAAMDMPDGVYLKIGDARMKQLAEQIRLHLR
jgi:diadenosine tetraphosphate (Ap4A) HIT family hydrolase